MATFKFYNDSALTSEITGFVTATLNVDGSTGTFTKQVFLGSTASGKTLQAESNPGVDNISISVVDAAPGTGHPASDVKLATTSGGIAGATPGAALTVGTSVLSGVGNKFEFWIGITDSTGVVGTSTELSLTTNLLREI